MDINVKEIIKEGRKEKGYTQTELANLLNVSPKAISRWETGNGMPDTDMLIKLSKILEVNFNLNFNLNSKNNLKGEKLFYSIILCLLFCLLEVIIYMADVAPKIAYVIFGTVFCIFVILDAICYK